MRVMCLEVCHLTLPSGALKTYPLGWSGDVTEDVAQRWIDSGAARETKPDLPPSPFTPEVTAVLAAAGEAALSAVQMAAEAPDDDLAGATVQELRAMAVGRGITGASKKSKAELISALSS